MRQTVNQSAPPATSRTPRGHILEEFLAALRGDQKTGHDPIRQHSPSTGGRIGVSLVHAKGDAEWSGGDGLSLPESFGGPVDII